MASKRELKKDIDYLTYEVIADCYTYMHLYPGKKEDKILEIINSTVAMRNDLFARVNNPEQNEDPKKTKAYFNTIRVDLLTQIDKAFQELSKLIK